MSRSEAARGRWTIYVCDDCDGFDESWEMFQDPGWHCAEGKPQHGEIRKVELVTASSLSLALEALGEIASLDDAIGYDAIRRARAVLDQLEEGERSQTASTEGSSE